MDFVYRNEYDFCSPLEKVLRLRGIDDVERFLNTSVKDLNDPLLFEDDITKAFKALIQKIVDNKTVAIIVDCDVDGYTSSAILLNYLHLLFPSWVENKISIFHHKAKDHGLSEFCDNFINSDFELIICPDSSSNDYECHKKLQDKGKTVLILDHHEAERKSEFAITVNNQLSNYPNKSLSGAGVVFQFCRYFDKMMGIDNAMNFIDLAALGIIADVMDLRNYETQFIVQEGVKNIKNEFFKEMLIKNEFMIRNNETPTPTDVAFCVAPYINSVTRVGTQNEKETLFMSLLNYKTNEYIESTKRGHKEGDKEMVITQALRVVTNAKNRQQRYITAATEILEDYILLQNLNDNKAFIFYLNDEVFNKGVNGLIANKLMDKYKRPVCVMTEKEDGYFGSARGYGSENFKNICKEQQDSVILAEGHPNAFGIGIIKDKKDAFQKNIEEALSEKQLTSIYTCDFSFDYCRDFDKNVILDIGDREELWGKGIEKSLIHIHNITISKEQINIFKGDTLKIEIDKDFSIVAFKSKEKYQEILNFMNNNNTEDIKIEVIGEPSVNKWMGNFKPQLILKQIEIKKADIIF